MAKKTELPPKPTTWTIYKIAAKACCIGAAENAGDFCLLNSFYQFW
jgi:hypothetical protein